MQYWKYFLLFSHCCIINSLSYCLLHWICSRVCCIEWSNYGLYYICRYRICSQLCLSAKNFENFRYKFLLCKDFSLKTMLFSDLSLYNILILEDSAHNWRFCSIMSFIEEFNVQKVYLYAFLCDLAFCIAKLRSQCDRFSEVA